MRTSKLHNGLDTSCSGLKVIRITTVKEFMVSIILIFRFLTSFSGLLRIQKHSTMLPDFTTARLHAFGKCYWPGTFRFRGKKMLRPKCQKKHSNPFRSRATSFLKAGTHPAFCFYDPETRNPSSSSFSFMFTPSPGFRSACVFLTSE